MAVANDAADDPPNLLINLILLADLRNLEFEENLDEEAPLYIDF